MSEVGFHRLLILKRCLKNLMAWIAYVVIYPLHFKNDPRGKCADGNEGENNS